ncbi:TetR/AcrR family transcriptional regulator [Streptomyces sp. H34-S4]|uniref:TetR/AcrR family transcriptional regulator n=1 Tax=Streptomyces sp. H34-S4 TaxID=2996463 RepID=UPI00227211AC|nr:TetR/AcrR family transcriptional regulator [Streptomyces sp. H34-S4]MCY0934247.1 TetR/AcrR family transcriptional regulator [Streptomyces sp. H34-S4]
MRPSAAERRESVLRAAVAEFATGGYHGTSTGVISRRAGVSQPYLFRLFPNKLALFRAAVVRSFERTAAVYEPAAAELRGPRPWTPWSGPATGSSTTSTGTGTCP